MPSSYWVVADSLGAGARLFGSRDGVASIVEVEVDLIVDLMGIESATHGQPDIEVRPHPIADFGVPTAAEMVSILDTIDGALDAGRVVYVHCLAGVGRTGTVVGCWLIRHRICPPREATGLIGRLRHQAGLPGTRSPETRQQVGFVESWVPGA